MIEVTARLAREDKAPANCLTFSKHNELEDSSVNADTANKLSSLHKPEDLNSEIPFEDETTKSRSNASEVTSPSSNDQHISLFKESISDQPLGTKWKESLPHLYAFIRSKMLQYNLQMGSRVQFGRALGSGIVQKLQITSGAIQLEFDLRSCKERMKSIRQKQASLENKHVRVYPVLGGKGYPCYFCHCPFNTVLELQSHLLTQEHLCLEIPEARSKKREENRFQTTGSSFLPLSVGNQFNQQRNINKNSQMFYNSTIISARESRAKKPVEISTKRLKFRNVMLDEFRCIYCGVFIDKSKRLKHACLQDMISSITKELTFMEERGSPFICILCNGSVYESPAHLQLHIVACHGPGIDFRRCSLCGVKLSEKRIQSADKMRVLMTIYQRHLAQEHLPKLLLTQKLLFGGCPTVSPKLVTAAPTENSEYRAYRCVFPQSSPAGKGPKYPFPHWLVGSTNSPWFKVRRTSGFQRLPQNTTPYGSGYPSIQPGRPCRKRAFRTCMVSPAELYKRLVKICPGLSNSFAQDSDDCCSDGQSDGFENMARFTSHLLCIHSGNPYSMPGYRELVLAHHKVVSVMTHKFTSSRIDQFKKHWLGCRTESSAIEYGSSSSSNWRKSLDRNNSATYRENRPEKIKRKTNHPPRFGQSDTKVVFKSPANSQGSRVRNSQTSTRQSLQKSGETTVEDLDLQCQNLQKSILQHHLICRLCLNGPMEDNQQLTFHIMEHHTEPLESLFAQMRKNGELNGLVDPMKTCMQCYEIQEDHFAWQIHMVVMHASRYPLVCGLCKEALINCGTSEDVNDICLKILPEFNISVEPLFNSEPTWKSVKLKEETKNQIPNVVTEAEESTINLLELDEIRQIRQSVISMIALAKYGADISLRAIESHERRHISSLRSQYQPQKSHYSMDEYMVAIQQKGISQGIGKVMRGLYKNLYLVNAENHEKQVKEKTIKFSENIWTRNEHELHHISLADLFRSSQQETCTQNKPNQGLAPEIKKRIREIAERQP